MCEVKITALSLFVLTVLQRKSSLLLKGIDFQVNDEIVDTVTALQTSSIKCYYYCFLDAPLNKPDINEAMSQSVNHVLYSRG